MELKFFLLKYQIKEIKTSETKPVKNAIEKSNHVNKGTSNWEYVPFG